MTEERLVLAELLEKAGESDFLRAVAEAVLQLLMETDVEGLIGAGRYERSWERTTWRNGYRDRSLATCDSLLRAARTPRTHQLRLWIAEAFCGSRLAILPPHRICLPMPARLN